jgi:hypothetical protein
MRGAWLQPGFRAQVVLVDRDVRPRWANGQAAAAARCNDAPMGPDWRVVLPWVGLAAMVAVLPFYLASGLVAPLWAIIALLLSWAALFYLGVRWRRTRPYLVLALPVAAMAWWFLVLTAGEAWLGWTA